MKKIKIFLIILICLIIYLPVISLFFPENYFFNRFFMRAQNLEGYETKIKKIPFSPKNWQNKSFQKKYDEWFSRNFGYREFYVRLINEIYYDIFKIIVNPNTDITIGKNEVLYLTDYINTYKKINPAKNKTEIEKIAIKIQKLQNKLKKQNKSFIFILTPSKAAIYPEFIPDNFTEKQGKTNYTKILPYLKKYNINYLDGHEIMLENKNNEYAPLFCKGGNHWNSLGVHYFVEEFINQAEKIIGKKLTHPNKYIIYRDNFPEKDDKDIYLKLNLFRNNPEFITPHVLYEGLNGFYYNVNRFRWAPEKTDLVFKTNEKNNLDITINFVKLINTLEKVDIYSLGQKVASFDFISDTSRERKLTLGPDFLNDDYVNLTFVSYGATTPPFMYLDKVRTKYAFGTDDIKIHEKTTDKTKYIVKDGNYIYEKNAFKPRILVVGGSFNYQFIKRLFDINFSEEIDFYYYYKLKHRQITEFSQQDLKNITPVKEIIKNKDLIILELNEEAFDTSFYNSFLDDILSGD